MTSEKFEVGKKYTLGELANMEYEILGNVLLSQDLEEITGVFVENGSGCLVEMGDDVYLMTPDARGRMEVLAHYGLDKRDLVKELIVKKF